jgi:hypothetical protein
MAELVDAPDLGSGAERCAGSSPVPGTTALRISNITNIMDELKQRLAALGLSPEQVDSALQTIAGFVKEKLPENYQPMVDDLLEGRTPDLSQLAGGLLGRFFK